MNECYMYHISMPMGHGRADGAARARGAEMRHSKVIENG